MKKTKQTTKESWEKVAKLFHDTYEEQAPFFGYITREDTREFNPKSNNGKLMIAVVKKIIRQLLAKQREEIEKELLRVVRKPNDMSIGDSKDFKRGFRQGFEVCWMRVKAKLKTHTTKKEK